MKKHEMDRMVINLPSMVVLLLMAGFFLLSCADGGTGGAGEHQGALCGPEKNQPCADNSDEAALDDPHGCGLNWEYCVSDCYYQGLGEECYEACDVAEQECEDEHSNEKDCSGGDNLEEPALDDPRGCGKDWNVCVADCHNEGLGEQCVVACTAAWQECQDESSEGN